jgi:precorrin-2 dehydrogenase
VAAAPGRRARGRSGAPVLTSRPAIQPLPVVLNQTGVLWVVVGGGRVAERKMRILLRTGADVVVVAPRVTEFLRRHALLGRLRWKRAAYRSSHLRGARFILAATSDPATNRAVARAGRRIGAFVGVADDPSLCTLFMPAVLRRGDLLVAVSTGGRSPGLARMLRDDLARCVGPEYASLLRTVGSIRARLRRDIRDPGERARAIAEILRATSPASPRARLRRAGRRVIRRATRPIPKRRSRHGGSA